MLTCIPNSKIEFPISISLFISIIQFNHISTKLLQVDPLIHHFHLFVDLEAKLLINAPNTTNASSLRSSINFDKSKRNRLARRMISECKKH